MKRPSGLFLIAALLFTAPASRATQAPGVTPPSVAAPARSPSATTAPPDAFSNQPINYLNAPPAGAVPKIDGVPVPSAGMDPTRVTLALGGVLALIFLLRWMMKKVAPSVAGHRASRTMKVITRCTISPRQHLLMIQVGRRLVVVGDAGSQLHPVCEISDPEEVSALLAQVGEETTTAATRFTSIFTRARKDFDPESPDENLRDETLHEEKLPEPNRDIHPAAENSDTFQDSQNPSAPVDPILASTTNELAGLSAKVRSLARQLGRQ